MILVLSHHLTMNNPEIIDVEQAAKMLNCTVMTVHKRRLECRVMRREIQQWQTMTIKLADYARNTT